MEGFVKFAENFTAGKSSSQQSTGFIIGLMGLLMIFVVFIGAVYWWKRKYFSKCSLTAGQNKSETTVSFRLAFFVLFTSG
ncbi:hypothetical protein RUM43_009156 [Polyplax serrata]|uniref:Uncharacterized protein n=1 Tax=Polyplax serrata TaxID=468196 RepID=A0AAN8P7H6_POLSC